MNSLVYPVHGGMEDWVYASGWDQKGLRTDCKGLTPGQRTAQSQAAVFLVETSDEKSPKSAELGCEAGVLSNNLLSVPLLPLIKKGISKGIEPIQEKREPQCNGHVQRNIRLSLSAIDLAQPYVCFSDLSVESTSGGSHKLSASWYVGGGHSVNATWLSLHASPNHQGAGDHFHLRHRGDYAGKRFVPSAHLE